MATTFWYCVDIMFVPSFVTAGAYMGYRSNRKALNQINASPEVMKFHRFKVMNRATSNGLMMWAAMNSFIPTRVFAPVTVALAGANVYTQYSLSNARQLAGEQLSGDGLAAWDLANLAGDVWP
jgi:hypothetical protein